jgi:glycosyltransferase involved in cell wall biosynthesis
VISAAISAPTIRRILFVTCDLPWPLASGGAIRQWNILQGLLQAAETDALVYTPGGRPPDRDIFRGCRRIFPVERRHFLFDALEPDSRGYRMYQSTVGRGLLTLGSLLPFEYQGEEQDSLVDRTRQYLDFRHYDLVWFNTARAAMPYRRCALPATVLDGDDFSHRRESSLLRRSPFYGAVLWNYVDIVKLRWWERRLPKMFTTVLRCSEEDRAWHRSANVRVLPNGCNIPADPVRTPARRLVFVGALDYAANAQGLEWFLRSVWPIVRQRSSVAQLDVIGKGAPPEIASADGRDGVHVHGFVSDITGFYSSASAAVVPVLAGGGTRLKILEALSHCVPVVATRLGAHGIPLGEQEGLSRHDTAESFADRCVQLLSDDALASVAARAGRAAMEARYSWTGIRKLVGDIASEAVATAVSRRISR